ncbi:IS66 family transposase [Shigella flexneri]|uniref:IS66 family transposase n=1 Tax=Shigella flexneri TaxID=623 RepID=UPI0034CE4AF1
MPAGSRLVRVFGRSQRRTSAAPPGKYQGVLQADAYAGYNVLYETGRVKEAGCLAHARRKSMTRMCAVRQK